MALPAPDPETLVVLTADLVTRALELVPIPAVQVVRENGVLTLFATNRAYRLAGLGVVADRSPMLTALSDQITTFLDEGLVRVDFEWTLGHVVDCRYYRVTIARSSVTVHDRCTLTFIDQTSQVHTERSMRREMTTDSLTGLPNREWF